MCKSVNMPYFLDARSVVYIFRYVSNLTSRGSESRKEDRRPHKEKLVLSSPLYFGQRTRCFAVVCFFNEKGPAVPFPSSIFGAFSQFRFIEATSCALGCHVFLTPRDTHGCVFLSWNVPRFTHGSVRFTPHGIVSSTLPLYFPIQAALGGPDPSLRQERRRCCLHQPCGQEEGTGMLRVCVFAANGLASSQVDTTPRNTPHTTHTNDAVRRKFSIGCVGPADS